MGKTLLHRQVTAADDGGLWTLQTCILPENRASLALHQSAGFRTLGVRERIGRHHGVWRDTVLLERRRETDPAETVLARTPRSAAGAGGPRGVVGHRGSVAGDGCVPAAAAP